MKQPIHARQDAPLRSRCHEDRQDQVKRLRHLHGGDEAKASEAKPQVEVKTLGSLGRVKAPALHAERDVLFDKWLRAYDNYERWKTKSVPVYLTNYQEYEWKPNRIDRILWRHCQELSEQLQRYDERINAATTTGPLLY